MNERINYEKQCALCKWADNTQAQCFDGHIQNIAGCKNFELDDAEITTKDLEIAAMKLYTAMARFGTTHLRLRFTTGITFDACFGPDEKEKTC